MNNEDKALLEKRGTLLSPEVTLHFLPYHTTRFSGTYIATYRDLNLEKQNLDMLVDKIQVCIYRHPLQKAMTIALQTHPQLCFLPINKALSCIVNSLVIKVLDTRGPGNIPQLVVAVYVQPAAINFDAWMMWRAAWRDYPLITKFYGKGRAIRNYHCRGCHDDNHPTGLCPFIALPCWNRSPMRDLEDREKDAEDRRREVGLRRMSE